MTTETTETTDPVLAGAALCEREELHRQLARLIFVRWDNDLEAACVAWRRLFKNSTTVAQFARLLA